MRSRQRRGPPEHGAAVLLAFGRAEGVGWSTGGARLLLRPPPPNEAPPLPIEAA